MEPKGENKLEEEDLYTVVCPGVIRSNSDFTVVASVHKSKTPARIKISIIGLEFNSEKVIEIQPYSYEAVPFQIPPIKEGKYNIVAEGLDGIKFKNETQLAFSERDRFAIIQTDKAAYKPGDLVKFRILILDKETCPVKNDGLVSVSILDSQNNTIKRMSNVEFQRGVFCSELQLSKFPNFGQWSILVMYCNETEQLCFDVKKYVLPKFEVTIEAPKDVYKQNAKINVTVTAKYTFGKSVKGVAVVTIKQWPTFYEDCYDALLTKTIPLNGKVSLEVDCSDIVDSAESYIDKYQIEASVKEALTELKYNASTDIVIHDKQYDIRGVNIPKRFNEGVPLQISVGVKNFDGSPVPDTSNRIIIDIKPIQTHGPKWTNDSDEENVKKTEQGEEKKKETEYISYEEILNENRMATVSFTPLKHHSYEIRARYLDQEECVGSMSIKKQSIQTEDLFELEIQTEKPQLDMEVAIKVSSDLPLKYFFYQIVARGNIVEAGKIDVPDDQTSYIFKFLTTFAMVPSCYVFVYYITNGKMISSEKQVFIEWQLNNFIEINAPTEAKVRDEIALKITTKPNSYVGILGVDQSVLLLKDGNDISKNEVIKALLKFNTMTPWTAWNWSESVMPGVDSGVITLTNAVFPRSIDEFRKILTKRKYGGWSSAAIFERKEFPETWLWETVEADENGEIILQKKVPDTITSWVLTAFSLHPEKGLGLLNEAHKLKVFQPFFISTNLPYSVKRGEVIAIPVVVFNYMDDNIKADLTLDNDHGEFEFVHPPGETKSETGAQQTKVIEIKPGSGTTKSFLIRPKKAGQIILKISAISAVAGDIVKQILRVDPEGVEQFMNKSIFLELKNAEEQRQEIPIEITKDAVPDSTYIEISVVGDLLGPVIENLDKLVRMPHGCGEQNMVNFVPNILVLRYLTRIKKLTLTIESKAKNFLEIGYQRELTYKHDDGSYSAFGKNDKSGSTWLTAYVVRSFHAAKDFTNIDDKVIKQGLDFLANNQAENGSFPETGEIIDHHHVDKSGKGLSLTAFTLLAFLENKEEIPTYQNNINKGLDYLVNNIDDETDIYSLAISAYTLQKAKHEKKDVILEKLNARQKKEGGHSWWAEKEPEKKEKEPYYWFTPQNANTEITAYGLLAQLEAGAGEETVPTLKWLVAQRNSNGGFRSTQDTVVGLQALNKFSGKYNVDKKDIEINFQDDKGGTGTIIVNDDNAIVLQTHVLNSETKSVDITSKGKGSTLVQVSCRYNIAKRDDSPRFIIKSEVKDTSNIEQIQLLVNASFIPQGDEKSSNMAVMEVSLPSGYISDEDNLNELETIERIKKVETKNGESTIVIYFDYLDTSEVCLLIKGFRFHQIAEMKPSAIIVYDYYDNSRQARSFYEIRNISLNEICEAA